MVSVTGLPLESVAVHVPCHCVGSTLANFEPGGIEACVEGVVADCRMLKMLVVADTDDIGVLRGPDQGRREHLSQNKINQGLTLVTTGPSIPPREAGLGKMRMTNRLPLGAFLSALLSLILFTEAQAADPVFCRQYAKAALNQVRGGLSNPACAGAL